MPCQTNSPSDIEGEILTPDITLSCRSDLPANELVLRHKISTGSIGGPGSPTGSFHSAVSNVGSLALAAASHISSSTNQVSKLTYHLAHKKFEELTNHTISALLREPCAADHPAGPQPRLVDAVPEPGVLHGEPGRRGGRDEGDGADGDGGGAGGALHPVAGAGVRRVAPPEPEGHAALW